MPGYTERELDTVRALNIASRGSIYYPRRGRRAEINGRVIIAGRPTRPYGNGVKGNARVTHIPGTIFTAWMRGRLVGAKVRWRCGGDSMTFVLTDEPALPLCRICAVYSGAVVVTVAVSVTHG